MHKLIGISLIATSAFGFSNKKAELFGKFTSDVSKTPVVALPVAIASYKEGSEALIHTEGQVKKVCEAEGCWMTLEDQGQSVRVFFKGHSFFVGRHLEGKKVVTEGVLKKKTQSVEAQKHLAKDAGIAQVEIDKIKAPLETFQFEATAVKTL